MPASRPRRGLPGRRGRSPPGAGPPSSPRNARSRLPRVAPSSPSETRFRPRSPCVVSPLRSRGRYLSEGGPGPRGRQVRNRFRGGGIRIPMGRTRGLSDNYPDGKLLISSKSWVWTNRIGGPLMPLNLDLKTLRFGTELLKRGFAKMQKGGVIMDVTNADQALIAEEAGAVAMMALERVPADIRAAGGVARMADPLKVQEIMDAVTIPVMAKCRIGHFAEAQALESMGVDMIDESEVLTPTDPFFHVNKKQFQVPFVCGSRNLGEAVRRIWEGAAMIRTKGEPGTGNVVEAVRHMRLMTAAIADLKTRTNDPLLAIAGRLATAYLTLLREIREAHGEPPSSRRCRRASAGR